MTEPPLHGGCKEPQRQNRKKTAPTQHQRFSLAGPIPQSHVTGASGENASALSAAGRWHAGRESPPGLRLSFCDDSSKQKSRARVVGFFSSHAERCHWNEPAVSQFSSTSPHIQVILYTCWARAPRRPDHARLSTRLTPLSIQTPVTHSPAARRFFSLRAGLSSVSSQTDLLLPSRLPLFTPLARPGDPTGPSAPQL